MNSWRTVLLGSCVDVFDSMRRPVAKKHRIPGSFPYYGAQGIVDHVHEYLFDGLHLLVAEDGENLRSRKLPIAYLAHGKFWVNNHAHVLRGNKANDTKFLCYRLESMDISGFITGSTQPKLNQKTLLSIPLSVPSLPEQRAIAATLGALDDKIESNRRSISILSQLIDVMSEQYGASCESIPLGEIALVSRHSVNPQKLGNVKVDHFSLPAFDAGTRPERVTAPAIKSNKFQLPGNAILVSRLNPRFNRTWWASTTEGVLGLASTEYLVLYAKTSLDLAAVWLAVRDPYFRDELPKRVTGTSGSHQRVRPDDVLSIEVPDFRVVPAEIKSSALSLLERADGLRRESDKLSSLRDALLPELMSGRVRVAEAREAAESVLFPDSGSEDESEGEE